MTYILNLIGKDKIFLLWNKFKDSFFFSLLILGLACYFFYDNLESFLKRELHIKYEEKINRLNKDLTEKDNKINELLFTMKNQKEHIINLKETVESLKNKNIILENKVNIYTSNDYPYELIEFSENHSYGSFTLQGHYDKEIRLNGEGITNLNVKNLYAYSDYLFKYEFQAKIYSLLKKDSKLNIHFSNIEEENVDISLQTLPTISIMKDKINVISNKKTIASYIFTQEEIDLLKTFNSYTIFLYKNQLLLSMNDNYLISIEDINNKFRLKANLDKYKYIISLSSKYADVVLRNFSFTGNYIKEDNMKN